MDECAFVVKAEDVFTVLLEGGRAGTVQPGATGEASMRFGDAVVVAGWEVRRNAVWTGGRLFFRCRRCARLAARLYVPRAGLSAWCRRCWGLTYSSRALTRADQD